MYDWKAGSSSDGTFFEEGHGNATFLALFHTCINLYAFIHLTFSIQWRLNDNHPPSIFFLLTHFRAGEVLGPILAAKDFKTGYDLDRLPIYCRDLIVTPMDRLEWPNNLTLTCRRRPEYWDTITTGIARLRLVELNKDLLGVLTTATSCQVKITTCILNHISNHHGIQLSRIFQFLINFNAVIKYSTSLNDVTFWQSYDVTLQVKWMPCKMTHTSFHAKLRYSDWICVRCGNTVGKYEDQSACAVTESLLVVTANSSGTCWLSPKGKNIWNTAVKQNIHFVSYLCSFFIILKCKTQTWGKSTLQCSRYPLLTIPVKGIYLIYCNQPF